MLDNLKSLLSMRDTIDALGKQVTAMRDGFDGLSAKLASFETKLSFAAAARDEHAKAIVEFRRLLEEEMASVRLVREQFGEEFSRFADFKREMLGQVSKRLESEIKDQVSAATATLSNSVVGIGAAKSQLDSLGGAAQIAQSHVKRLADAASALKDQDLQLADLFSEVRKAGDEKAQLLLKIDMLERLVSQQRRRMRDVRIRDPRSLGP